MPCHSYSPFLCSLLQSMLQENESFRPSFAHILATIRPYIKQAYFQEDFLKDLPQQQIPQMFLPHSPLQLRKNLSNVQLLQKSIMKSESKAMLNDSYKKKERSPMINNSVKLTIQTKPTFMHSFQGSAYSTDLKTQSYMQNPSQLSPMGNQQQPYLQQVCQTRSIQNNSKIIQKENQFTRQRQNTSFYCSPGQQTMTLTTPISPISKGTQQRIILTPLSRSPLQQTQHQNELNISDQMFCSPTIPKQVRFFQQSPYMHSQASPNVLQQKVIRKIPQQPQLVQKTTKQQVSEPTDEQILQSNRQNETGSNKDEISNNEKITNNEQGSNNDLGSNNEKDSNNEKKSSHTNQSQKEDNQEDDILDADKQDMNAKNINLRNAVFDKITEVSKEIENNTENEKVSQESQPFQNFDQEISQEWQLVDHQEEDLEQPNYIEIIEQKIKQALRNSQQTISKVQGQQQPPTTATEFRPQQQQYQEINQRQFQRKQPMQCVQYRQQQTPIGYNQAPVQQQFPVNAPSPHQYYRTYSPSNINICYRPQQVLQFYPQNQKQRQFR